MSANVQASGRVERIRAALTAAFHPTQLEVIDDSAKHAGHAGAAGGAGHFRVRIVAAAFGGRSRIETHRMVYAALDPLLEREIHALSIDARAI